MPFFYEQLHCPVCKTFLGERVKKDLFIGHCDECQASFIWKSNARKPEASLDKCKPKICGCGRCGR